MSTPAAATAAPGKPRLLFFRWPRPGLPHFIEQHLREHVRCLALSFDVVVVDEDCDYGEMCERHEPDLALFESGVYAAPRRITNTAAHPEVPKVGFLNADAYCPTRSVFLSDMELWGVDTFFTLSVSAAEYTPEIADDLFVWPNFVDADLYPAEERPRNIPVLFMGSRAVHYPWRNQIFDRIATRYPAMTCPHSGWFDKAASARMFHGAAYAGMLASTLVAPTCGSIAREVVRKHFEIPAAGAVLLTERTAGVEEAGFRDGINCLFAEPDNVVDILGSAMDNPDELARIAAAGQELVRTRHTMRQRDQIRQWWDLRQVAAPSQRIVQDGPFGRLRLVDRATGGANRYIVNGALDRGLLRRGDELLRAGRVDAAEEYYLRCLSYHTMSEPALRMAMCRLRRGDAGGTLGWVGKPIETSLRGHHATTPDPVEWAYLIRAHLCAGDVDEAIRRAGQFVRLNHPELDRIRAVVARLGGAPEAPAATGASPARTVHALPMQTDAEWRDELHQMLTACRQPGLAAAVSCDAEAPPGSSRSRRRSADRVFPVAPRPLAVRVAGRLRREWAARDPLRGRWDPLAMLDTIASREDIRTAVIHPESGRSGIVDRLVAGLRRNPGRPELRWEAGPLRATVVRSADMVVLTGQSAGLVDVQDLGGSRLVVVDGVNRAWGDVHASLAAAPEYQLIGHQAAGAGWSVFQRIS